uniref:Fungal lipase-like domain-containing protein n=1 Tax=Kalanchoe fedtschenkoi TaxID=63787 RepID=A0A7N0ZW31_KALFE
MWIKNLRYASLVVGVSNFLLVVLGGVLVLVTAPRCGRADVFIYLFIPASAAVRLAAMYKIGIAQEATATTIVGLPAADDDGLLRHKRRVTYKRWLWWTRFALMMTVLQFLGAAYLIFDFVRYVSYGETSRDCVLGTVSNSEQWKLHTMVSFVTVACFVALFQCFAGSDVYRWRSFYMTQDKAWKAHYREVFDHGIREALCCLGRVKYLSALDEDEVHSVAQLLGDLVAYRASGTGHLELLAGLALLQRHSQTSRPPEDMLEAPEERFAQAATFHQFAEAAYTGPLLDFGRNPFIFPCAWLYRQGILTPWSRNRRPMLQGDNWLRGHAAAYLKYVKLPAEALRRGRVCQAKREAAYFIVVLHHVNTVVIAVRGTETPEDLLTDGLCRECTLSEEDLEGLLNNDHIHPDIRRQLHSSSPHYGHSGIVEAARDLFSQVDGNLGDPGSATGSTGFLSSLLGPGCECDGYKLCIVGHSLGGAIASLLGIRLYGRYPNLHVYAYGSLPCLDFAIADACSDFITTIVYDNEFSARLSVSSILRLRGAALTALSQDPKTDTALVFKLARRFLYVGNHLGYCTEGVDASSSHSGAVITGGEGMHRQASLPEGDVKNNIDETSQYHPVDDFVNPFHEKEDVSDQLAVQVQSEDGSAGDPQEVYLPGLIIHIAPQDRSFLAPLWNGLGYSEKPQGFHAYIADRKNFKDIDVSPSMFLDHLPWRCHYAMRSILEARRGGHCTLSESQMV